MGNGVKGLFTTTTRKTALLAEARLQQDQAGKIAAISKSQAVIEFNLDGSIIVANDNFLSVTGYRLEEIVGQHHSLFVHPSERSSPDYSRFWQQLNAGEFVSGEFKRVSKSGNEIWIQASYNPIFDDNGKPCKVVKFATDITDSKILNADVTGQIDAIHKSQAVIEFNMDGTIRVANDNFLATLGYSLGEIQGKPHRMFVESDYGASREYKDFWDRLRQGEFQSGEYKRIGKGGREVWIQASYNPILDLSGRPFKVVKYATDTTAQKQLQQTIETVLEKTQRAISAMARGDLTHRMDGDFTGEFATLQSAINDCFENLHGTLSEIRSVADNVSSESAEIANGNNNLSQRTVEQASNLEETASSMEEMTTTVQQNAANASNANELALSASQQAKSGGAIVDSAVRAMDGLNESSKKISDIIGVINDIAFQTNLLALNASVEAARAGNQGRGFAVVASEVRDLAGRSATAAKEIKELIEDSAKRVDESSDLVNQSGNSLGEIVNGVDKVTSIVGNIAIASKEQSIGISGVNNAITQVDELTQQNAALVEQAASASKNLNNQAKELDRLVSSFKLHDQGAVGPATGLNTASASNSNVMEIPKRASR